MRLEREKSVTNTGCNFLRNDGGKYSSHSDRFRHREIECRATHGTSTRCADASGLDRTTALQSLQPLPTGTAQTPTPFPCYAGQFWRVVIDVVKPACDRARDLMLLEQRVRLSLAS